jgi:hypothetical protein
VSRPRRTGPARNDWTREQETRPCRRCGAEPGHQCVTASGTGAPVPHAERFNDALAADGKPPGLVEGWSLERFPGAGHQGG